VDGKKRRYNSLNEVILFDKNGRAQRTMNTVKEGGRMVQRVSLDDIRYENGRVVESRDLVRETGEKLDRFTVETMRVEEVDSWGRSKRYVQTVQDGLKLTTHDVHDIVYNADGRVVSQVTDSYETSLAAGVALDVHQVIRQTGMVYDAQGNLVDYTKSVTDAAGTTTYVPVAGSLIYDESGRLLESMVKITPPQGPVAYELTFGNLVNDLGQTMNNVTVNLGTQNGEPPSAEAIAELRRLFSTGRLNSKEGAVIDSHYALVSALVAEIQKNVVAAFTQAYEAVQKELGIEPRVKAVAPSVGKLKGWKTAPALVSVPTSPRLEKSLALMAEALPSLDHLMQDPSGLAALAALAGGKVVLTIDASESFNSG
jgi:hypothetical protein